MLTRLTAIIATTFAIDGASQIALALTVPTQMFVGDSTGARIPILGTGLVARATDAHRAAPGFLVQLSESALAAFSVAERKRRPLLRVVNRWR